MAGGVSVEMSRFSSGAREPSPSLDDALAAYAIDTPAGMKTYLDRAAVAPTEAGECPKILTALARVARLTEAGVSWTTSRMHIEVSALSGRSIIDVYVEQDGARERMMPGVLVDLSISEIERAVGAHSVEILPLRRSHAAEVGLVLITHDDRDLHERTTRPVPVAGPYEAPTKSGKHKKQR